MTAITITLANNKGGSAKTTSATTLGHGLATIMRNSEFPNPKVLLIDTDSQAHSTLLLTETKDHDPEKTLYGCLKEYSRTYKAPDNIHDYIMESNWDSDFHILPAATVRLDEIETSMEGLDGSIFALRRIIAKVKDDYQIIIIDTCPKFSLLTKMALIASDQVIIPMAPASLDADGLASLIERVYHIREQWEQTKPDVTGIIVAKFHTNITGHNNIRDIIAKGNLSQLYLGTVPLNAAMEYAHEHRESIFNYEGRSSSAQAYGKIVHKLATRLFQTA